jgi:nucleoside phosphorylase
MASHPPDGDAEGEPLASADMESAAVAREAARHGLPFIAFRAVSDGPGDPLNLPGFPAQFFAYYRLAADNAAAAAAAFVELL